MTKGEMVIRPDFAKNAEVKEIKQLFTILYDKINNLSLNFPVPVTEESFERCRCYNEALRNIETGSMYAVKGLTI